MTIGYMPIPRIGNPTEVVFIDEVPAVDTFSLHRMKVKKA